MPALYESTKGRILSVEHGRLTVSLRPRAHWKLLQAQPFLLDLQCVLRSSELHLLPMLDPEPKSHQDVFFSWCLIGTTGYMDLGKGGSPPEIRPLCVLGDGAGETFSAFWKLP